MNVKLVFEDTWINYIWTKLQKYIQLMLKFLSKTVGMELCIVLQ